MFQDDSSLAMHYQQAPESSGQKTCTICQMLLPNQCSFLSHQRIHQHKSPYICPECGASCRSVHFQSHVTKNCLHYTRRVGYRCVHCSVIFADIATVKSHIQSTHCEVFYKCPLCPMAFKSAPGTHSHAHTQHPGMKAGEPKVIHKCSMCDTVFTLQSLLYTHFDQHVVNHKVSVFKCPDCSMHYAQKQLMLDHIKATHGTLKTIEGPPNLGINLPLSTKPTNSNSTNSPMDHKNPPGSGYTCGNCNNIFSSREVFVAHMRREHGKILKKHPCRQCDKSFSSSHSLCRHNRLKHKGLRKVYTCPHCPALSQPFTKRVLLDQHIQLMHGVKDPEGKTVKSDNTDASSNKKTPRSPKRKPEEDEGLKLKGLGLTAIKEAQEDITAFHEHIPQHKSDGSSYQCQECGLCYTSHRSLARHLFIVHRLKEPQGLGRYNGRGKDDDESQRENQLDVMDENNDGTPNTKCKVCGKLFETEVYDAFGKMGSNVEGGNANRPGLLQQCHSAHGPTFSGQYCQVFLRQGTVQYFEGICVPDSCGEDEVQMLVLNGRLQFGQTSLVPPLPHILANKSTQELIMIHCLSNTIDPDASDVTCLYPVHSYNKVAKEQRGVCLVHGPLLGSIERAEDKLSLGLVASYLFKRIKRIQPLHLFIMCLTIGLISLVQWGPYWFPFIDTLMDCKTYWWANLLLISNLLPVHEIWQAVLGWFCCLSTMAVLVGLAYVLRETPAYPSVPHALYQGLHRPLWALAVTWIILACEEGYGGFINSLLSLGFWVPLSNISFACYLTHPVFIIFYIGLQETPIHYTDINFMYLFLGHLVLTLVVSYVFTVLIEKPYLLLQWNST
ncbi:Zinc finger protein 532 [Larimichthys crocea]|uniref:Zinc finger protein 532 n=1 Tax=Larimichthys crocea TaxID=215358 RepID=A0A6G0I0Y4_LARCR|nr:Zinc finger protein 532 [Larimichthys crocea]